MKLGKRLEWTRGNAPESLKTLAKCIVNDPQKEAKKIP